MIITLTRVEGPIHECGKPVRVASFTDGNRALRNWSYTAPKSGYDKVDFQITDNEGVLLYVGRYDLVHWHIECTNLFAHVIGHIEFAIDTTTGEQQEKAKALLKFFKDLK